MFRNLKSGISSIVDKLKYKKIDLDSIENLWYDLQMVLLENDVSYEVTELIYEELKKNVIGIEVPRFSDLREYVKEVLRKILSDILDEAGSLDLLKYVRDYDAYPFVILFLGVNGVGKTTTIAKIAYLFKEDGFKVSLACSDTFRAGAIEQLRIHSSRLSVPMIAQQYGADPAAVAYDAVEYAKNRGYHVVLIDTAGRQHSNINLMEELKKICRVVEPHYKILVVDALTGQDAVFQARMFHEAVGVDGVVFTKVDSDVKGGAIVSVASVIKRPILFLGVGQDYKDLIYFDKNRYLSEVLGD
jgi:fused signal recognition particle receptor